MIPHTILAPISLGELVDKITILEIKSQHLQGAALDNVRTELKALNTTLQHLNVSIDPQLIAALQAVNSALWQIEDAIRDQERQQQFGDTFVQLARSVYKQNDQRAALKRQINIRYGSALIEEKLYQAY